MTFVHKPNDACDCHFCTAAAERCPFCGHKPHVFEDDDSDEFDPRWWAVCDTCQQGYNALGFSARSRDAVIAKWNRRADFPSLQKRRTRPMNERDELKIQVAQEIVDARNCGDAWPVDPDRILAALNPAILQSEAAR